MGESRRLKVPKSLMSALTPCRAKLSSAVGLVHSAVSWGPSLRFGEVGQPVVVMTTPPAGLQADSVRPVAVIGSPAGVVVGTVGASKVPDGWSRTWRSGAAYDVWMTLRQVTVVGMSIPPLGQTAGGRLSPRTIGANWVSSPTQ